MIVDVALSPFELQLRNWHRENITTAPTLKERHRAIKIAYWINRAFPDEELLIASGAETIDQLIASVSPGSFEHLCPRCCCQHEFTMTLRGYFRRDYLCPACLKLEGISHGG